MKNEIILNTWNISRADLITYLKTLGCTECKMGGGTGYQVFNFPEIVEIMHGGQILAYIPDQGGATTLPSPDSFTNIFPPYLRKQILVSRKHIYEMHQEAMEAAAKSQPAQDELLREEDANAAKKGKGKGKRR